MKNVKYTAEQKNVINTRSKLAAGRIKEKLDFAGDVSAIQQATGFL